MVAMASKAGPELADAPLVPPPPLPKLAHGPELEALKGFHFDCRWEGQILAGWGGPDTPEIKAAGRGTFKWILNDLWLAGEFTQDHFVNGYLVGNWLCHYVVGWDPRTREYRAVAVDTAGNSSLLHGAIEGQRFVLETVGPAPIRVRLSWDLTDPDRAVWRNEVSEQGGPWQLIEEYYALPADEEKPTDR